MKQNYIPFMPCLKRIKALSYWLSIFFTSVITLALVEVKLMISKWIPRGESGGRVVVVG